MLYTHREIALVLDHSCLPVVLPSQVIAKVIALYGEDASRFYHDFDHAIEVLSWVNCVLQDTSDTDLAPYTALQLRLAALFHDIVYGPEGSPTNEKRSCDKFRELTEGLVLPESANRVCELIMFTAYHGKLESADVPLAGQLMLDADLASLGQRRWEIFLYNNENVVEELKRTHTTAAIEIGRRKFLKGMLTKESIYLSEWFRARFEAQARRNLTRVLGS